ncbi:vascular endothelial growth factor D [Xenopus laevis]|uniref:Vascular endothelial growth factor D n=2 Tax=Xenopus laevis TaxID=8355 RepID=A0A8J0UA62_XENLA|nr:vascular endothelial growth factor D [Xenopus laevis]
MIRPWAIANLFVFSLHLLQGFDNENMKGTSQNELEMKIRSAANLEEFLRITHPRELKLWRCRSKLKSYIGSDSRSASHRSTRFAAAFYDIEILKVIDEEWQKTQCIPRETCVDVGKDLGTSTNTFFKPPCVSVFRCGGCCNEEGISCVNTSTSYVFKTLFEISVPLTQAPEPVTIKIANHTSCKCTPSSPRLSKAIIRRSVHYPEYGCDQEDTSCPNGWQWDSNLCECVLQREPTISRRREELAICGAHMEFEDNCECVCKRTCPSIHHVLNQESCLCECRETLESCAKKQKIFFPDTCSCEDKCPFQIKECPNGKQVCAKYFQCPKERRGTSWLPSRESP